MSCTTSWNSGLDSRKFFRNSILINRFSMYSTGLVMQMARLRNLIRLEYDDVHYTEKELMKILKERRKPWR